MGSEMCIRDRFPDIRNHRRSQLRIDLSDISESDRNKIVSRLLELFSSSVGQEVIDSKLTQSIDKMRTHLIEHETDSELTLDVHTDQIESFGNTFKELLNGLEKNGNAEKLINAVEHIYLDEIGNSLEEVTREIAKEDTKKLVKTAIRAKQAKVGATHYGPKLIDKLPPSFNWFRRVFNLPEI